MRQGRKLRTRAELEAEYDALVNYQLPAGVDRSFELAAVVNCLRWVLWGEGESPTQRLQSGIWSDGKSA